MQQAQIKDKKDWVTPTAIVIGVVGVATGLIFWLKKKGFAPGDKIDCQYIFQHAGPGGHFIFRVTMGHTVEVGVPVFNEMEETRQEFVEAIEPSLGFEKKKVLVTYQVPDVLAKDKYDLEASLRWPDNTIVSGMRVIANDIIVVE